MMSTPLDAAQQLDAGLQDLGLALSPEQKTQLLQYAALISKWNKVYNLTALRAQESILSHHLLDCLAIVPAIRAWVQAAQLPAPAILDVGAGAGLPGLVLAICQPDWQIHTIDTVGKKTAFMQQVAASLQLKNVQVHHARVEELAQKSDLRYNLITSRAFSALDDFVTWTAELLAEGGVWAAMKGKAPSEEDAAALPAGIHIQRVDDLQVPQVQAERCLVWLEPSARP